MTEPTEQEYREALVYLWMLPGNPANLKVKPISTPYMRYLVKEAKQGKTNQQ